MKILKKKLYEKKLELNEIKKKLNEKKDITIKSKSRPNSINKRKVIIKELQKRLENYKYKSRKNSSYTDDFSF